MILIVGKKYYILSRPENSMSKTVAKEKLFPKNLIYWRYLEINWDDIFWSFKM